MNSDSDDGEAEYVPMSIAERKRAGAYNKRSKAIIGSMVQAPPKKRQKVSQRKLDRDFVAGEDDIEYRESTTPSEREFSPYIYNSNDGSSPGLSLSGSPQRILTRSQRAARNEDGDDGNEFGSQSLSARNRRPNKRRNQNKGRAKAKPKPKKQTQHSQLASRLVAQKKQQMNAQYLKAPKTKAESFLKLQFEKILNQVEVLKAQVCKICTRNYTFKIYL